MITQNATFNPHKSLIYLLLENTWEITVNYIIFSKKISFNSI